MRLDGKTVLVSGAEGGIGRAIGLKPAGGGARLIVADAGVTAIELGPFAMTVDATAPRPIDAPPTARIHRAATRAGWSRQVPAGRRGTVAEVAGAALHLACGEVAFTGGPVVAVDGGFPAGGLIDRRAHAGTDGAR